MKEKIFFSLFLLSFLFSKWASAEERKLLGALGDSITRAFGISALWDSPSYSWASGERTDVRSHYTRLKENGNWRATNTAKTGAKASDLERQVDLILSDSPDYITLLMGANDVCSWPDEYQDELKAFEEDISAAITDLIDSRPDIKITLSPIPNMYLMYKLGLKKGCSNMWGLLNLCQRLLGSNRTEEDRQRFVERWKEANRVLEEIAIRESDHVKFTKSVSTVAFEEKHLSGVDCFHPSAEGQRLLSEVTWNEGWFTQN